MGYKVNKEEPATQHNKENQVARIKIPIIFLENSN